MEKQYVKPALVREELQPNIIGTIIALTICALGGCKN